MHTAAARNPLRHAITAAPRTADRTLFVSRGFFRSRFERAEGTRGAGDRVVVAWVSGSGVTSPKCRFQGPTGRAGFQSRP
jgi:hypothetical protein